VEGRLYEDVRPEVLPWRHSCLCAGAKASATVQPFSVIQLDIAELGAQRGRCIDSVWAPEYVEGYRPQDGRVCHWCTLPLSVFFPFPLAWERSGGAAKSVLAPAKCPRRRFFASQSGSQGLL